MMVCLDAGSWYFLLLIWSYLLGCGRFLLWWRKYQACWIFLWMRWSFGVWTGAISFHFIGHEVHGSWCQLRLLLAGERRDRCVNVRLTTVKFFLGIKWLSWEVHVHTSLLLQLYNLAVIAGNIAECISTLTPYGAGTCGTADSEILCTFLSCSISLCSVSIRS